MTDKAELQRLAAKTGYSLGAVEKDHALTWALKALYGDKRLGDYLVFKGGTCLNKVYFPETWRLSEDLDFSVDKDHDIKPDEFKELLENTLKKANEQGAPNLKIDHYFDNGAFIRAKTRYERITGETGPHTPPALIKLEISRSEKKYMAPERKTVKTSYHELKEFSVKCYCLREIFTEKLRALMQRSYARDYYDIWQLTKLKPIALGLNDFEAHLHETLYAKCEENKIPYEPEKIFTKERVEAARNEWIRQLEHLIAGNLPTFDEMIGTLEDKLAVEKSLADFSQLPSREATGAIVYNAKNEYILRRAIKLLSRHLESKNPAVVEQALDAAIEFAGVRKFWSNELLASYEKTIQKIKYRPHQGLRLKATKVLKQLKAP